ncbi:hypothetical protein KI387_024640, partial [Taxus chinensis]
MVDLMEEARAPWDENNFLGVGVGFPKWMMEAWLAQVVKERSKVGLDEEEEEEVLGGDEDIIPMVDEGRDGGLASK